MNGNTVNTIFLVLSILIFTVAGESVLKLERAGDTESLTYVAFTMVALMGMAVAAFSLLSLWHDAQKKVEEQRKKLIGV